MPIRRAVAAIVGAATVFGVVVLTAPSAQAAATLPSGFSLVDTPSGQAAGELTDVAYLPGGDMLTTGRKGAVYWIPLGGQPVRIATIPVSDIGELGLTGIAVASDYAVSRTVYTIHAVPLNILNKEFRLSKWKVTGTAEPTGLAEESILLRLPVRRNVNPNGIRDVAVDPTGTILWVAVGDSADIPPPDATADKVDKWALRAMDPAEPTGKILRIRTDGRGADDNPYFEPATPSSWRSRTYTSGLRNPRITLDPRGGVIVTDTGWLGRDEVNLALPGQNMKWPCWEGTQRVTGYRDLPECAKVANNPPLQEITRTSASTLTGGVPYTGTSYPEGHWGAHFIADKSGHTLSTLRYNAAGKVTQQPTAFATDIGDPVSVVTAPNGDIAFGDGSSGLIRRLSYEPANKTPTAAFKAAVNPDSRTVVFDAGASRDLDYDALTYQWEFGDGASGTGRNVTHAYSITEPVSVRLTVTDVHSASVTITQKVVPNEAGPELTLTTPNPTTTFAVGENVALAADATDTVDGPLTPDWSAEKVRCLRGRSCETTPLPTGTGPGYLFKFPNETDAHVVITATAYNSRDVAVSKQYIVKPRLAQLYLSTSHVNQFLVGTNEDAVRRVTVGSTVRVTAPDTALNGSATFSSWSDTLSSVRTRDVRMPESGITLKADYTSPIQQRHSTDQAIRDKVGTQVGFELIEGGAHYQQYTTGRLYWTEEHKVKAVYGETLEKYVAVGAHAFLGAPSTDLIESVPGQIKYNDFVGTPETGLASIYWQAGRGAFVTYGAIREKWLKDCGWLGYPTGDQAKTPDGVGHHLHLSAPGVPAASVYSHPEYGAHCVFGAIRDRWAALNWEAGQLGYPISGENWGYPDIPGEEEEHKNRRFVHFAKGSIYFHFSHGAHDAWGGVWKRWTEDLGVKGWVAYQGYPITPMTETPGRTGYYVHFDKRPAGPGGASIYWKNGTETGFEVIGAIRAKWAERGWENSYLGYPKSGEHDDPNDGNKRRSDFDGGYILYDKTTHVVSDHRW